MRIILLNYNNYANRIVKGYVNLADYNEYVLADFSGINFNPNDGVNAELILNTNVANADYLLTKTEPSTGPEVDSRWFVIECERTRGGQYKYTLRRDVIYDNVGAVLYSTAEIERGYVNVNDSAIYNQEAITTNQIKRKETLLKQPKNDSPWIVGYLTDTANQEEVTYQTKGADGITITDAEFQALSAGQPLTNYSIIDPYYVSYEMHSQTVKSQTQTITRYYVNNWKNSGELPTTDGLVADSRWNTIKRWVDYHYIYRKSDVDNVSSQLALLCRDTPTWNTQLASLIASQKSGIAYDDVKQYTGKNVAYNNKVYSVRFVRSAMSEERNVNANNTMKQLIAYQLNESSYVEQTDLTASDVNIKIKYQLEQYTPVIQEVLSGNYKCTIPAGLARTKLQNQPYSMFCMSWEDAAYQPNSWTPVTDDWDTYVSEANRCIAQAIAEKFSSSALIDMQLVPYCPLVDTLTTWTNASGSASGVDQHKLVEPSRQLVPIYKVEGADETVVSYLYFADKADFTFNIDASDLGIEVTNPDDALEFKVNNQCDMYRLCSPNYNGQFEFSATKNGGLQSLNIDCTYKPFNPYIHVNPEFSALYGSDYNDARGLICGGDFSLPQSSDAWASYEINNKNYDNIFNRGIKTQELNNKYAKIQDWVNMGSGSLTGAVSGGTAGAAIGGPYGAVAGAVAGGALSAAGGIANAIINPMLREEAINSQKDIHQYELQNIQAIPDSLTKVGALNFNNKIYPFIEYYTCTDEEKEAVRNIIRWYNMNIGRIGVISDYIDSTYNFIKARILRIDINEDYHMANVIKQEVADGLYLEVTE